MRPLYQQGHRAATGGAPLKPCSVRWQVQRSFEVQLREDLVAAAPGGMKPRMLISIGCGPMHAAVIGFSACTQHGPTAVGTSCTLCARTHITIRVKSNCAGLR